MRIFRGPQKPARKILCRERTFMPLWHTASCFVNSMCDGTAHLVGMKETGLRLMTFRQTVPSNVGGIRFQIGMIRFALYRHGQVD